MFVDRRWCKSPKNYYICLSIDERLVSAGLYDLLDACLAGERHRAVVVDRPVIAEKAVAGCASYE